MLSQKLLKDNIIFCLYFLIVSSISIYLYGGLNNFLDFYLINADNFAYHKIYLKFDSYFGGNQIDIKNNIAIPGLSLFIFIFAKLFFLEFVYAYILLMLLAYLFTLNLITILFNNKVAYLSLIFGWEFVVTSTTGGTEPIISFLLYLSIYLFLKKKFNSSYILICIGSLTKPFIISVFATYFIKNVLLKRFSELWKIVFLNPIIIIMIFFSINYILYRDISNIHKMYYENAWLSDQKNFNIPIIIFFKSMFNSFYKIDHTLKVVFYFLLTLIPIMYGIIFKLYLDNKINIYFFILVFYFLIVFCYPSIWAYYEFVRFISPVVPIAIYIIYEKISFFQDLFKNKYIILTMLLGSSLFYSCANFGLKNTLNLIKIFL